MLINFSKISTTITMPHIKLIFMCTLCLSIFNFSKCQNSKTKKVLFNYGDFNPKKVSGYDFVIIESAHFDSEDLQILKENNETVLAYLSFGEVNESASHYREISSFTLGKNEIWNSHVLDLANRETRTSLLNSIENDIRSKGFDGIFMDNIDNYTSFGPTPGKLKGLISFLGEIKEKFPKSKLMQNAGLQVLPETISFLDAIAVESIATSYDFQKSRYQLREKEDFKRRLQHITAIQKKIDIPVILIEYANSQELYKKIQKRLKNSGMNLFVGEIELQSIPDYGR